MFEKNEQLEEEFASIQDLEKEVEAKKASPAPDKEEKQTKSHIPDKFKNKSLEDIVEAYSNLEQEFGRRSNEIGELRKLTDSLLGLQLEEKEKKAEPPREISSSELFDNPRSAIQEVLKDDPELRRMKEQMRLAAINSEREKFEAKNPDWKDIMFSTDFQTWVQASPTRTKMLQDADKNYDYATGAELLNIYKEIKQVNTKQREKEVEDKIESDLKDADTIRSSGREAKKKVYRRDDLIKLRMYHPDKFNAMHEEIMTAYKEGRVK